jgi:hypothetical protein
VVTRFLVDSSREWEFWMRVFVLYTVAVLGNILLINLSERWYGATWFMEWLFGLLTVGIFVLFTQGWKRHPHHLGLIFITGLGLFTINSIFFIQYLSIGLCSFLLGLWLIPLIGSYRDAVLTAWGFVLLNILSCFEVGSEATLWLFIITTGMLTLIGFYFQYVLLRRFFTVIFSLTASILFLMNSLAEFKIISLLAVLFIVLIVIVGAYRFSRDPKS